MRVREYGVLFLLALIWGASFLFIKIAVDAVSPATLVAGRLGSSVLVLGTLAALRPDMIKGWRQYARLSLVIGLVNLALPFILISWGEQSIPSGTASILDATTPLFTVLLANWWRGPGREALTLRRAGGVLIGFLGVGVLIGPAALTTGGWGSIAGDVAVLLASLCYGIGTLGSSRYNTSSTLVGPLGAQVGALIFVLPAAALWSPPTHVPPPDAIGAILMLGIPGLAIAYLLYFWLIRHVGASRTSLVTYLLPCTALIWGALLLHEQVGWNSLAGLALVLLGTLTTNGTITALWHRLSSSAPRPELPALASTEGEPSASLSTGDRA